MSTQRPIAIAPITTPELPPPEMVSVAARTGYSHVGLRMLPSTPDGFCWPLMTDAALRRETLVRMQATGVGVLDIDIIRLRVDTDPSALAPFFEPRPLCRLSNNRDRLYLVAQR